MVAQIQGDSLQTVVVERVPAAEQAGAEGGGEGRQEEPPERGPRQRAALPPPLGQADAKGAAAASRNGLRFRAEASIVRSSIFMELELKKEKLNLHFTKKLRAQLRPSQGAGLEVTVGPRRSRSSRRSSARAPPAAPHHSRSGAGRSFCYVCMPADPSGARLKTVCWAPPAWILEMNGYRQPQVARFARPSAAPRPPHR